MKGPHEELSARLQPAVCVEGGGESRGLPA